MQPPGTCAIASRLLRREQRRDRQEGTVMLRTLGTIAHLSVAAALAFGPLPASGGDVVSYAGIVSSIDRARGTLVVRDVGPWHGGSPAPVTPRSITLTPSTKITVASRTWEATATSFPG